MCHDQLRALLSGAIQQPTPLYNPKLVAFWEEVLEGKSYTDACEAARRSDGEWIPVEEPHDDHVSEDGDDGSAKTEGVPEVAD